MTWLVSVLVVLACGAINRLRGDEAWKPSWMPGRALIYASPAIAAVSLAVQPWPIAIAFGAGYVFWAVWGWGFVLMRVGGRRPARNPDVVERCLLVLPGSIAPVFARMLFVLPAAITVAWLTGRAEFWLAAPAFSAIATVAYHALFQPIGRLDWLRAEVVCGALWGVMICTA